MKALAFLAGCALAVLFGPVLAEGIEASGHNPFEPSVNIAGEN